MRKQFLFAILMLMPMMAMADDSGTCGDNLTWTYTEATKTLTISGTGDMRDYVNSHAPWYSYRESILKVLIDEGVTYYAKHVSFYGTEFANALGTSIITFNSSGNPIGLYDLYDFNGTDRPFINQLLADIGAGITYILNGKDYIITKGSKHFDYVNGD